MNWFGKIRINRDAMKSRYIISELCSTFLLLLFVYAAVSKLMDLQQFVVQLGKSPMLNSFVNEASVGVPLVEIVISLMFFINKLRLAAFYAAYGLMVVFTVYIFFILNFSYYIPCSCGGVIQNLTWTQHLIVNIAFIVLSGIGVLLHPQKNLSADRRGIPKTLTRVGNQSETKKNEI